MRKNDAPIVTADNTDELFKLFHFVQMMDMGKQHEEIADIGYPGVGGLSISDDMCFYHITKLSYDEEYPRREAFENVLNVMEDEGFNFVYILSGNERGVELYIGVVKNHREKSTTLSTVRYGEIVENAFKGNFSGSSLCKLEEDELQDKIIGRAGKYTSAGIISGIPSINESDTGEEYDFQGIDRLINSMLGQNWRVAVVCEPVCQAEILRLRDDVYELYNRLSVFAKISVQK